MTSSGFKFVRPPEFLERCRQLLDIRGAAFSVILRQSEFSELVAEMLGLDSPSVAESMLEDRRGRGKVEIVLGEFEVIMHLLKLKGITRYQFKGCVGPQNAQTLIEVLNSAAYGNDGNERVSEDSMVALVTFKNLPA